MLFLHEQSEGNSGVEEVVYGLYTIEVTLFLD